MSETEMFPMLVRENERPDLVRSVTVPFIVLHPMSPNWLTSWAQPSTSSAAQDLAHSASSRPEPQTHGDPSPARRRPARLRLPANAFTNRVLEDDCDIAQDNIVRSRAFDPFSPQRRVRFERNSMDSPYQAPQPQAWPDNAGVSLQAYNSTAQPIPPPTLQSSYSANEVLTTRGRRSLGSTNAPVNFDARLRGAQNSSLGQGLALSALDASTPHTSPDSAGVNACNRRDEIINRPSWRPTGPAGSSSHAADPSISNLALTTASTNSVTIPAPTIPPFPYLGYDGEMDRPTMGRRTTETNEGHRPSGINLVGLENVQCLNDVNGVNGFRAANGTNSTNGMTAFASTSLGGEIQLASPTPSRPVVGKQRGSRMHPQSRPFVPKRAQHVSRRGAGNRHQGGHGRRANERKYLMPSTASLPDITIVCSPEQGTGLFAGVEVESLQGRIYATSIDQDGCRFLQTELAKRRQEIFLIIYEEVKDHLKEMMTGMSSTSKQTDQMLIKQYLQTRLVITSSRSWSKPRQTSSVR